MSSILEKNPQLRLRKANPRRHSHFDGSGEYFYEELAKLQMLLQSAVETMQQDFVRLHEQLSHLTADELARLVEATSCVILASHYQANEVIQKTHLPDMTEKNGSIDPLSKARQRGQAYVAAEWRRPENLTLMEA